MDGILRPQPQNTMNSICPVHSCGSGGQVKRRRYSWRTFWRWRGCIVVIFVWSMSFLHWRFLHWRLRRRWRFIIFIFVWSMSFFALEAFALEASAVVEVHHRHLCLVHAAFALKTLEVRGHDLAPIYAFLCCCPNGEQSNPLRQRSTSRMRELLLAKTQLEVQPKH